MSDINQVVRNFLHTPRSLKNSFPGGKRSSIDLRLGPEQQSLRICIRNKVSQNSEDNRRYSHLAGVPAFTVRKNSLENKSSGKQET
ncbi:hypothetical protein CEXT_316341 [Caerostris extrusa]|uniref:Uncharacterized protein n=1 Tax=Caerostris extrusa TaxID=172846 RepID=A0AAV4VKH8_CAEEX|nr:hypothetical protein CEXT_316341 [Caerostris extrusa]